MPDDLQAMAQLVQMSKYLNQAMATTSYNPNILLSMPQNQLDTLLLSVRMVTNG